METLGMPLKILWSGGIDSTLVMVSFLKQASIAQKERITVLLSDNSIAENPRFYEEHIRGKIATDSSVLFPYMLGSSSIIVGGECNDQIFGSDIVGKLMLRFGPEVAHMPYNRDMFQVFFTEKLGDASLAEFYIHTFERLHAASPIPLDSNLLRMWWVNFSLKWQFVYIRALAFTPPHRQKQITKEYLENQHIQFYNTEEFQLWSLNNPDKRMKDAWNSYKWPCKDIIYSFTKDADYRDHKLKFGSLYHVFAQLPQENFIDTNLSFSRHASPQEYVMSENDFL